MSELQTKKTDAAVEVEFDEGLYPKDAIFGAAYIFIDRCYVYVDRKSATRLSVSLTPKEPGSQDLDALAGEFANELLGQAWRRMITDENRQLIEQVSTLALGGAAGPTGLDELMDMDIGDETAFDDPLGIALSWEEKYKKKGPDDAAAAKESGGSE